MIYTYNVTLPSRVHGFVHETPDGDYAIYINNRLSVEMQRQTYDHELQHIINRDFDMDKTAAEIERPAGTTQLVR